MKKYIKPIPLFFLISAVLALLAAFWYDSGSTPVSTSATGSTISSMKEEDRPANEIPLPDGITIHEFFYDPANNGIMKREWLSDEKGNIYFFDRADGHMLTGWNYIGGEWFYLETDNRNGQMVTGWKLHKGNWYFLGDTSVLL